MVYRQVRGEPNLNTAKHKSVTRYPLGTIAFRFLAFINKLDSFKFQVYSSKDDAIRIDRNIP